MTDEEMDMMRNNAEKLEAFEKLTEAAMQMWQMYQAFLEVGFNEEQALRLVLKAMEVARG